jgi:uncharacterized membrane protein
MEHVVDEQEEEEENEKGLFQIIVDSPKGRLYLMTTAVICLILMSLMSGDVFSFCLVIVAMIATVGLVFFLLRRYAKVSLLDVWEDLAHFKRD